MSINVTVTGNPVSVRRGKMVTTTGPPEEFDRRRLVRLEQVRQQSRDIADGVREKVRKEKRKQLCAVEEEGREKLKRSQNRRLLELQTQYREGLSEMGAGHREADEVNDRERLSSQRKATERRDAVERSRAAAAALLPQPKPAPPDKSGSKQKRAPPIVKTVPTTKSVKKIPTRHVSKKRRGANINIDVPGSTDTDDASTAEESSFSSSGKTEGSSSDASPRRPPLPSGPCLTPVEELSPPDSSKDLNKQPEECPVKSDLKRFLQDLAGRPDVPEPDTRISERIRRRELRPLEPDPVREPVHCACGKSWGAVPERQVIDHRSKSVQVREERRIASGEIRSKSVQVHEERSTVQDGSTAGTGVGRRCPCDKTVEVQNKSVQVREEVEEGRPDRPPDLPEVNMRTVSETFKSGSGASKVQFYDHASRTCTERRVPVDSYLERNSAAVEALLPSSEGACCDARKDDASRARFRSALERDRIGRDYDDMLRRLPLLERRERVAAVGRGDKPEHHAGEERAREGERRRQNAMENEFVKTFREAVVTLPKKSTPGTWDEERPPATEPPRASREHEPKIFTANEVQDIVKAFAGRDVDERRRKLRQLLDDLKLQKDELIKEIGKIPRDDSVDELIRDLDSVTAAGGARKRGRRGRRGTCDSSSSSSSSEVRAKGRKERKMEAAKVLQTVSTQTSDRSRVVCDRAHVPCDCAPELCEILIRVGDEGPSEPAEKNGKDPPRRDPTARRTVATNTDRTRSSSTKWQESLVKNSFSTTSTSYRSPPDFRKFGAAALIPYIERLLSMSRAGVDELSVSQVSSVATPSQSVVDIATNRPVANGLEELVKYFAGKSAELPHTLAVSPDDKPTTRPPSSDSRESLMRQYANITESCSKRIENLAEMIRKLRDEKDEMLGKVSECCSSEPECCSSDEEELFRKMTEIDEKLAKKLKGVEETKRNAVDTVKKMVDPDSSNAEMVSRLERLNQQSGAFVPFLSDIPKLPKFEPLTSEQQQEHAHRKPPPSKGLRRVMADDDKLVPHELSTIPEGDSQVSKLGRSLEGVEEGEKGPEKKATPTPSSSDSLEEVLRKIGMEWAIPTLQKTKEAMEMASTSATTTASTGTSSKSKEEHKTGFVSLLTNSSEASTESAQAKPPRTSTPVTSSMSPSMAFSDSSSISYIKRGSNDS